MALTEVSTTDSDDSHNKTIYEYSSSERAGVICISVAGLLSLTAILFLMIFRTPKPRTYQRTHLYGYVMSLFMACTLQSVGTVMNLKWVLRRQVEYGLFCAYQGAIKHFGNISIALWSFMISLHLFHLLFMRGTITHMTFWFQIILGWSVVNLFVIIGPLAIEKEDRGPYYGISGPWCWITSDYPKEQVYLEYFFEFFSAGLSLILYSIVILRVRGNIIQSDGNWCLRIVPRGQSWQLSFGRDLIDSAMLRVAQNMVWYPVAYTVLLIPITITRLTHFGGHDVPFGVTIFADVVFNLTGFVNAIMLLVTTKLFPDMSTIPDFRTKRNKHLTVYLGRHGGVTPFTLERSETAESWEQGRMAAVERQVSRSTDNDGTSTPEMTVVQRDVSSNGGRPRTPLLE